MPSSGACSCARSHRWRWQDQTLCGLRYCSRQPVSLQELRRVHRQLTGVWVVPSHHPAFVIFRFIFCFIFCFVFSVIPTMNGRQLPLVGRRSARHNSQQEALEGPVGNRPAKCHDVRHGYSWRRCFVQSLRQGLTGQCLSVLGASRQSCA